MYKISERCPGDHACPLISLCPVSAISQASGGIPTIDQEKCIECGACMKSCPGSAVAALITI